uniref:Uncharacterized protein n=1 Tax=Brassica oleracea var. oleracea TaxID=109376 RepID=A0A0D3D473_BRAOL
MDPRAEPLKDHERRNSEDESQRMKPCLFIGGIYLRNLSLHSEGIERMIWKGRRLTFYRDFWGWQSPAGTSAEHPQIATMKEKSSHHPKRESRALQTRFGGTEERSIKYESDPRTVNFISVLPLIQKEPGNGQDIIGKISMPDFQIIYPIVKSTYVCVYDQPGDEATLVKHMVSDQSKLALQEYHIDLILESSGVALLEPSRFGISSGFFRTRGKGEETSGLAMLQVRACGADTFVPWTLLERAGIQRQTVLATASCVFMLELNFHSGSSIYSNETDEKE